MSQGGSAEGSGMMGGTTEVTRDTSARMANGGFCLVEFPLDPINGVQGQLCWDCGCYQV